MVESLTDGLDVIFYNCITCHKSVGNITKTTSTANSYLSDVICLVATMVIVLSNVTSTRIYCTERKKKLMRVISKGFDSIQNNSYSNESSPKVTKTEKKAH